jgi:hypothetical protein
MINCPKCGRDTIKKREADRRSFYICLACGGFTFEPRKVTGPYETIVDEIAEGVAARRYYEIHTAILINTAFKAEPDRDSHSQMMAWAAKHLIRFERNGKMTVFQRNGIALGALMRTAQPQPTG